MGYQFWESPLQDSSHSSSLKSSVLKTAFFNRANDLSKFFESLNNIFNFDIFVRRVNCNFFFINNRVPIFVSSLSFHTSNSSLNTINVFIQFSDNKFVLRMLK
uniref:Uncharacterized protein n=1 Tax=Lepeophtheirus salmonis TaxID=72036 RepID=A0A0K2TMK3_LEPSM